MHRQPRLRITALVVLAAVSISGVLTRRIWMRILGQSLVCTRSITPSDAIVVDNFDYNYLLFEETADLQRSGIATRIFVPAQASASDPRKVNRVSKLIVDAMASVAEVRDPAIIPVRETEPISLNVAYGVLETLTMAGVRSVVLVTPAFRSRRSMLIYQKVLSPAGIAVACAPVFGSRTPETWTQSWHGIEEVTEQFMKLQYYRLHILPSLAGRKPARSDTRAGPQRRVINHAPAVTLSLLGVQFSYESHVGATRAKSFCRENMYFLLRHGNCSTR